MADVTTLQAGIRNVLKIPDLRNRILFMLGMLAVYRVGSFIPTPGIDSQALQEFFAQQGGTIFGMMNLFVGGNLSRLSIFALGIMPYITASIIFQLLTVVWPYLERLSKEGELGRKKINQYTRYLTVGLSAFQGFFTGVALEQTTSSPPIVPNPGWGFRLMTMLTLTAGTVLVMWLGEQITERGIGNGISLIIFAGIVVGLPSAAGSLWMDWQGGERTVFTIIFLLMMMLLVTAGIVAVERAQRRIPVQYAKRVVGRKMYGGQATHLPLRINSGGVIPVIFAASIVAFPSTLGMVFTGDWVQSLTQQLAQGYPLYNLIYIGGIFFFTFFYVSIIFNPDEVADNIRKYGGYIPGIRPGRRTSEYIDSVLSRLTTVGAIYLVVVCLIPEFLITGFKVQPIPFIGPPLDDFLTTYDLDFITTGLGVNFYFGGTSLLIVVAVAMDTVQQIESQLIMRHYEGFLKKGRVRGRRG
ncbi:MAG: preprotein translocase subunit SecY [Acidobacteriota bacterium]|nr:MAG: preprotein translocase subunit SecY [Acidobacteriota bacterium]